MTGACPVSGSGPNACYPYADRGGGWRVVMDSETTRGLADHSFHHVGDTTIDTLWRYGTSAVAGPHWVVRVGC